MTCQHLNTSTEDGRPGPRLFCDDCGAVLLEPPGWLPAEPRRACWVRRCELGKASRARPLEAGQVRRADTKS